MAITGKTLLTATIGDPVDHLQAPESMGAWFAEHEVDAVWLGFHVRPEGLADFIGGLRALENLPGFTVTMPHKHAIIPLLDEVSERVRRCGACNLIRREPGGRLVGDIADGIGFVAGLKDSGVTVAGRHLWLVGAGGAGTAIAWAVADEGPAAITIVDVDPARQDRLAGAVREAYPAISVATGRPDLKTVDIAVNATPSGLHPGDPLPYEPAELRPDAVAVDIIMKPPVTALLVKARGLGLKTVPGQKMLDGQLRIYAEYMGLAPRG